MVEQMVYDEVAAAVAYAHEALLRAATAAAEARDFQLMFDIRILADKVGYLAKRVSDAEQNFSDRNAALQRNVVDEGLNIEGFSARLLTPQEIGKIKR